MSSSGRPWSSPAFAALVFWPMTRWPSLAALPLLMAATLPQAQPAASPSECEQIVREIVGAIATAHRDSAVRSEASKLDHLPRDVCAANADVRAAVRRALASFDDPAMRLLEQSHFERTLEEWSGGATVGVGLSEVLSIDTDEATRRLTVIAPVPGSPAADAGLRARDVVVSIDGVSTDSLGLTGSMRLLRPAEGESVRLEVLRADELHEVVLTAERLQPLAPVLTERRASGGRVVLLVRLSQFIPGTADTLRGAIASARGVDAILLDLRDNPGGMLDELVAAAGVFLEAGSDVARIAGASPATLRTEADPIAPDVPLAVLVGPGTASVAEVLAGALQANGRARVYGARTFGKGLAHQALPLDQGAWVFMLPVGQLELPDGRRVLRNGIDPDVRTANPVSQATFDLN